MLYNVTSPHIRSGKKRGEEKMLQLLKRVFGGNERTTTCTEERKTYITPELHHEMLAKKSDVAARRRVFWKTLSHEERQRRQFELDTRVKTNMPMRFKWVDATEGTPVGFPLFIFHITLHDMFPLACDQFLTEEVQLAGLKCNAVSRGRFVRIGELEGFIEVQPRWVEELDESE